MSLVTPKLIATDLDGTIVRFDGTISKRTVNALNGARDKGALLYIVTGRPPRWLADVTEAFGVKKLPITICGNGALTFDVATNSVLGEDLLQPEVAAEVIQRLRAHIVDASFACEFGDDFRRERNYHAKWDVGMDPTGVEALEEAIDRPMLKLLVRCSSETLSSDDMLQIARAYVSDLVEITYSNPEESFLEISALGVNKGTALAKMAGAHGFTSQDCIAFGDNPNDIPMLEWAGRSWAMASGHRDAKAAANFVTSDCDSDGVAEVIEELFGLERKDW